MKKLLLTMVVSLLGACAQLPERNVPEGVLSELPADYAGQTAGAEVLPPAQWWTIYGDPQLDSLLNAGLENNSDLLVAAERLREARALHRLTRSGQLPVLDAAINGNRSKGLAASGQSPLVRESGSYGVDIAYEIDVWGRLASASEADWQRYLQQGYNVASLRLTVAAEIVRTYLQLQSLTESRDVLAENVSVLEDQVRLSERRFELGAIAELDLQRFRSELEDSRAQLAETQLQRTATGRALVLLTGRAPSSEAVDGLAPAKTATLPEAFPAVPVGLPSDLLDRRPDLRAAEAALAAASADLAAARRAWFPGIVLTGSAGRASTQLSELFTDSFSTWSAGLALTQAIFDGGRRSAAIEVSAARREQLAEQYRSTVRRAFAEVLNALDERSTAAEVHAARRAQTDALSRSLLLAQRRYDQGYSDYLDVLDAHSNLLRARLALATDRRDVGLAYLDLVLSVGGGWDPEIQGGE